MGCRNQFASDLRRVEDFKIRQRRGMLHSSVRRGKCNRRQHTVMAKVGSKSSGIVESVEGKFLGIIIMISCKQLKNQLLKPSRFEGIPQ